MLVEEPEAAPAPSLDLPFTAIDWTAHAGDADGKVGAEVIQTLVKRLPNAPGVYRMMNAAGDVLYVGKARSLKKRVTNYANGRFHTNRIGRMVRETATMEFVVTRTEIEALLLEANLIKRLRPRFNVLMRDDKSFPYIVLTGDHPSPGIFKHRGARSRKGDYFGPFASAGAVGRTINSLQRAFLLSTCTDSVFESRTRPCLLYQIKRCSGPCTGEISAPDYAELVEEAKDFLSGRSQKVKTEISQQMQQAAEDLDFERAAVYRDRLAALSHVQSHQGINPQGVEEADVFAIHQHGGQVCIQVFFFRTGQNWGNRAYFPKADPALEAAEVLVVVPRPVLRRQAVPALDPAVAQGRGAGTAGSRRWRPRPATRSRSWCRSAARRRIWSTTPCRMPARRWAARLAETSTQTQAARRLRRDLRARQAAAAHRGLRQLAHHGHQCGRRHDRLRAGRLREEPVPQVQHPLDRHHARRRFRHDARGDGTALLAADQGAWRGALPRRRAGDDEAENAAFPAWPDVILIDGGQGQMTAVRSILQNLGIEDRVVAIGVAKGQDREAGRERFFARGKGAFSLPVRDPVLYFVQRLRDEAHRFAIGSHRARRKKEMVQEPARRDQRHRARPQARAAPAFRHRQGGEQRRDRRSDGGGRHFGVGRAPGLQPFPRKLMGTRGESRWSIEFSQLTPYIGF